MTLRFRLAPTSVTAASRNQWQPNDGTSLQLMLLAPDDVGSGGGTATLPGVLVATISGTGSTSKGPGSNTLDVDEDLVQEPLGCRPRKCEAPLVQRQSPPLAFSWSATQWFLD